MISAFITDIESELTALNELNQLDENKVKLNDKLRQLVELHHIAKQLSIHQYHLKKTQQ